MAETDSVVSDEAMTETGYVVFDDVGRILRRGSCRPSLVAAQGRNVLALPLAEVDLVDDRLHRVVGGRVVEDPFPDDADVEPARLEALRASRQAMRVHRAAVRKALLRLGRLDAVDAAMTEGSPEARIAWFDVTRFDRLNPDVEFWALAAGLDTDDRLDAFFRFALAVEGGGDLAVPDILEV